MDEPALGALADYLSAQRGEPTAVLAARRLSVGHSRAMYRVDTDGGSFVVRVEQGGVFGTSSGEEFGVMAGAGAGRVPGRPRPLVRADRERARPAFLRHGLRGGCRAARRAGHGRGDRGGLRPHDGRPPRARLAIGRYRRSAGRAAGTPDEATHLQIDRWAGLYRAAAAAPIPLLEEAAAWLHHRAPPLERLSVVHGDAGPGNVVQADGTDRRRDGLGVRPPGRSGRGLVVLPVDAGIAGRSRGTRGWSCSTASPASAWTRPVGRYWEAFNLFKGACANCTCLDLFERGGNRAPNMAIIGTVLHRSFLRRLVEVVHR